MERGKIKSVKREKDGSVTVNFTLNSEEKETEKTMQKAFTTCQVEADERLYKLKVDMSRPKEGITKNLFSL